MRDRNRDSAFNLVLSGLLEVKKSTLPLHPLIGGYWNLYQGLILVYVFACVVIFAWIWRTSFSGTVAAIAAMTIGASLATFSILIRYDLQNLIGVTHPIELLFVAATFTDNSLVWESAILNDKLVSKLIAAFWTVFSVRVLRPFSDNMFLLDGFIVGGLLLGW